jgi:hypothetical protein
MNRFACRSKALGARSPPHRHPRASSLKESSPRQGACLSAVARTGGMAGRSARTTIKWRINPRA